MIEDTSYAESPVQTYWSGWEMIRRNRSECDYWTRWEWAVTRTRRDGGLGLPVAHIVRMHGSPDYVITLTDGTPILPASAVTGTDRTAVFNRAIELFDDGQLPIKP